MPKRLFVKGDPWTKAQTRKGIEARRRNGTQHVITAEERLRGAKKAAAGRWATFQRRRDAEIMNLARQALFGVRGEVDPALLERVAAVMRTMADKAYMRGAKAERVRAFRQSVRDKNLRLDVTASKRLKAAS